MKKIRFRGREGYFKQFDDLGTLRETFDIGERKNIYRVAPGGELLRLDDENISNELKDNDMIEAVSEFILG